MRYLAAIWWVAAKDLRSELRSRENLITVLFFALVVLVVFHYAFDLAKPDFQNLGPGLLWVAISFAGMMGMQSSLSREREGEGLSGLLLSTTDPSAIYLGKTAAALLALLVAEAFFVPVMALLFGADLRPVLLPLAVVLAVHSAGLSIVGTLFATMSIRLRRGYLLLPLLQFTVTVPLLMSAVKATAGVLEKGTLAGAGIWLRLGLAYDMIFVSVAAVLFEHLIEE